MVSSLNVSKRNGKLRIFFSWVLLLSCVSVQHIHHTKKRWFFYHKNDDECIFELGFTVRPIAERINTWTVPLWCSNQTADTHWNTSENFEKVLIEISKYRFAHSLKIKTRLSASSSDRVINNTFSEDLYLNVHL